MSSADVIRRTLAAFNRRDLAGLMADTDPEAEFVTMRALLEGTSYRGEEGLRQFFVDADEDWSELSVEEDEVRERGDTVLLLGRMRVRGRASGVDMELPAAWVIELEGGKVVRLRAYPEREQAIVAFESGA